MYRPTEQLVEGRLVATERALAVSRGDLGMNSLEEAFWRLNRRYGANLDKIGYNLGKQFSQQDYERFTTMVELKLEHYEQTFDATFCSLTYE